MSIPDELSQMLNGEQGPTRQKAARLVVDLASVAGSEEFVRCSDAHVSGVSVLTGGHGLRTFLADLTKDPTGTVAIQTTLNSAGCDHEKMDEMDIEHQDFLEQQFEIIHAYMQLGIKATLSCTPYDRGIETPEGIGSWAESNAVCFSNSYTSLITNRESGLSALATALTGWAPKWGLHLEVNRHPNLLVEVEVELPDATDWSVLGDWIGAQRGSHWRMPFGPIPVIRTQNKNPTFEMRKALTAAAANHGCPMLWLNDDDADLTNIQDSLTFTAEHLDSSYAELAPKGQVDLVVIGCPQASIGEVRATAAAVRTWMELGHRIPEQRLWVFTSGHNHGILKGDGTIDILEEAGALILKDTCPEVTPYNRTKYNHLLTNSLKAEHYLTSGLNRMPTSVARIEECVAVAFDPLRVQGERPKLDAKPHGAMPSAKTHQSGICSMKGVSLPSQTEWMVEGAALVTDVPITYLGYVNRDTGVIEDPGHPLDGIAIENSILIYPKGSGSTVAPYVLMGLMYTGKGPKAIVNRDVCPLSMPAASLLGVPYATGFDDDPCMEVNTGDRVRMKLLNGVVNLEILERATS